jgi:very-short-patch-repair endonuclease
MLTQKLPASILNYYAAFTETKFNFKTLINYRWTNNALTLDLSLFQLFQDQLLQRIKTGDTTPISIRDNEYTLSISGKDIGTEVDKALSVQLDMAYLESCIARELSKIQEKQADSAMPADRAAQADADQNPDTPEIIDDDWLKGKAFHEGTRKYNRAIRKHLETILNDLHDQTIARLKADLGIDHVPASIFNSTNFLKTHFDALQRIARECHTAPDYFENVTQYFKENREDIVLYDLFINMQRYARLHTTGTAYLFFHELHKGSENGDTEAYPVFFAEVEFLPEPRKIVLSFPRNVIYINTPAVNYFRFPSVLTVARSTTFQNAEADLGGVEIFLQAQYGWTRPFILEPHFMPIAAPEDIYPDIRCRVGFQVVQKENKKLLDYSEIMTRMNCGQQSKFSNFIKDYIDGNVKNTQDEVDWEFKQTYPVKNPSRYISDNPLNLNNDQKRILLALKNFKNRILVVDGPPGTGKSHTIAALTYWGNQEKKSVVITSHKKEALDVIDRMLTEKFRNLHPQGKPSIVRFGKNGNSINTLENSLQNAVINAAGSRANDFNEPAITSDAKNLMTSVVTDLERQLATSDTYDDIIMDLVRFDTIEQELFQPGLLNQANAQLPGINPATVIDFDRIDQLASGTAIQGLKNVSLPECLFLLKHKDEIPAFLTACEQIHLLKGTLPEVSIKTTQIPSTFVELLATCLKLFKPAIAIDKLTAGDMLLAASLKKIINKTPSVRERETLVNQLKSLEYASILEDIGRIQSVPPGDLTLQQIDSGITVLQTAISLNQHLTIIQAFQAIDPDQKKSVAQIHDTLSGAGEFLESVSAPLIDSLSRLFDVYGQLLSKIGITASNLQTLSRLTDLLETETLLWEWVRLHYRLSGKTTSHAVQNRDLDRLYDLKQKEIEHINDARLKNLNNFLGDIARIKVSFSNGKRFTMAQARVLLDNIAVIIAEPDMISGFFPMEEDMIDLLIIDEASQVSIASSISLILRARQVVIFGDEYQYGAVSAVNVNARYSASYFKEIIQAYSHDFQVDAADEETDTLLREVSREISEDDLEADQVLTPRDAGRDGEGTILWLKTFNIRTSTLSFAKAIANYTTSLKEHYRSFPEIIDYSNEFFYRPAQLELIVNRIRTRPIREVLCFIKVDTQGNSGRNVNFDEIDAIIADMGQRMDNGFTGTIGIITSFREQEARMAQALSERMNMPDLKRRHNMAVWFVGDVQGEERDLMYYSFVEDKKFNNADLSSIYPVVGGTADNPRSLKMQRLNVGFSRAKNTMVFVHSMPITEYSHTRLGDALKHFQKLLDDRLTNDFFVPDTAVFESPAEEKLYQLLINTDFVKHHRSQIHIVPQFNIGEYIRAEFKKQIPKYRVDFLMTLSDKGKDQTLILEYDGVEFHTRQPERVTRHNFSQQYLEYDVQRQIELESYGYRFLRLNKFTLRPSHPDETSVDVLDRLLRDCFNG